MLDEKKRCDWAIQSEAEAKYHDEEWGVPCRDDLRLFEFLILEGAQAGLSWRTILNKREGYQRAFEGFDVKAVAAFDQAQCEALRQDTGIVRNRAKIASAVGNAQAFIKVQQEFGSFANYLWGFVEDKPIQNSWTSMADVPATSAISDALSKDLKKRGFKFVGSTICYAYMQSMGLVNDHLVDCHCYRADSVRK